MSHLWLYEKVMRQLRRKVFSSKKVLIHNTQNRTFLGVMGT